MAGGAVPPLERARDGWRSQRGRNGDTSGAAPRRNHGIPENTRYFLSSLRLAEIRSQLRAATHGEGGFTVFVGVNGSREELGLEPVNYFVYSGSDLDAM